MRDIPASRREGMTRWTDRGHWFALRRVEDGSWSVKLSCPTCGQVASLDDHAVDSIGAVTPSVVCPSVGCDFHDYVRLVGWPPT